MKQFKSIHILLLFFLLLFIHLRSFAALPYSDEKSWDGKFKYGAFSTTISGYIMATQHAPLIAALGSDEVNSPKTRKLFKAFLNEYAGMSDNEVKNTVTKLIKQPPNSIFTPFRTTAINWEQNRLFLQSMSKHSELKPKDYLLTSPSFYTSSWRC